MGIFSRLFGSNKYNDAQIVSQAMTAITALDRGERTGPNPDEFNYIPS